MIFRYLRCWFPASLLALWTVTGLAQDSLQAKPSVKPAPAAANDSLEQAKLKYFRDLIGACRLTIADRPNEVCQFIPEPPIKFENPISHIEDGFLFLWTDRGRPAAVVKSYHNVPNKTWGRTYVSLATQPMEMRENDKPIWTPDEPGLAFAKLPKGPAPAARPAQRLTQMREIARRFQFTDRWGIKDPTDWQLRLLPTPLHRYDMPAEDVRDGALFGYALTTAPEALLLLEIRNTDSGPEWHYAVSRCTRFEIRVSLDGTQIAEFPRLESWPIEQNYRHLAIPLAEYPFPRKAETDPK